MDFLLTKERIKGILVDPQNEWLQIDTEPTAPKELLLYYVLPFAAVAALISLITIWASTYFGFMLALRFALLQLLLPIISIVVAAVVINELAETFDSVKNLDQAFKLVVYSYTPVLLISLVTSISWTLSFLGLLGLYGAYLFWVGLPVMMKTPENKRLVYIIAALVVMFIVRLIVGALFGIDRLAY